MFCQIVFHVLSGNTDFNQFRTISNNEIKTIMKSSLKQNPE